MLLEAVGCVTLSPLEEANIQGDGPDLPLTPHLGAPGAFFIHLGATSGATEALLDTTVSKTGCSRPKQGRFGAV